MNSTNNSHSNINSEYRLDIDGIRAIAVCAVILFHFGILPNGYLGVDVFFVISGFLITGIIHREIIQKNFSIIRFYERRVRRIIPLTLFSTTIVLILAYFLMLPDDLENACQSIIATNLSANNILMWITSSDYWAVKNEYKPLMHTWSLGIEEQFYLIYPLLVVLLEKHSKRLLAIVLSILTIASVALFLLSTDAASKFYWLQYRFFELSIGGLCSLYFRDSLKIPSFTGSRIIPSVCIIGMVVLMSKDIEASHELKVLLITFLSAAVLTWAGDLVNTTTAYWRILAHPISVFIGKISFSLYIWHQITLAFTRYYFVDDLDFKYSLILIFIIFAASIMSYYMVEKVFRDAKKVKFRQLILILGVIFIAVNTLSFLIYLKGGVVRDVPELGYYASDPPKHKKLFTSTNNIHIEYNSSAHAFDKDFSGDKPIKVLVVGNSFARDFVNVIKESKFYRDIDLSYVVKANSSNIHRFSEADYVFYACLSLSKYDIKNNLGGLDIDANKLRIVGIKDFGNSNGIHYRHSRNNRISPSYRAAMKHGVYEANKELLHEWNEKYIDLISLTANPNGEVAVFTPNGRFISQDTLHFTKDGASYYALLLDTNLQTIFNNSK